jgi:hypothetical protein
MTKVESLRAFVEPVLERSEGLRMTFTKGARAFSGACFKDIGIMLLLCIIICHEKV